MDNYRSFDLLRANELSIIKHGFFNNSYEISDGQFLYGKVSYRLFSRCRAVVETADGAWTFSRKQLFSRTIIISKGGGEIIGEVTRGFFSQTSELKLYNGFEASFAHTSFLPVEFTWSNSAYGEMLKIRGRIFAFYNTVKITINSPGRPIAETPLLAFLSIHLLLLRQRRKAAR